MKKISVVFKCDNPACNNFEYVEDRLPKNIQRTSRSIRGWGRGKFLVPDPKAKGFDEDEGKFVTRDLCPPCFKSYSDARIAAKDAAPIPAIATKGEELF